MTYTVYQKFYRSSGESWSEVVHTFPSQVEARAFCEQMNDQFLREGGWFFVKVTE